METEDKDSKVGGGKRVSEETKPHSGKGADRLATFNQYRGLLFRSLIECVPSPGSER